MTEALFAGARALLDDPIVAVSTAPGRGAIGTVRLSGLADAVDAVLARVLPDSSLQPRRATLVTLVDPRDGQSIDRGIATRFVGPRSYTGEDVVELDLHGSPALLAAAVEALVASGARPAGPGEFTRRAVIHGKMDLVAAEAVDALVQSESLAAARLAGRHLDGELSARLLLLRGALLEVSAALEALVDLTEEVDASELASELARLPGLRAQTASLADSFEAGRRITEGVRVVLAGPVNAGKSTLFNLLLGHPRAIVSDRPGTTRDVVSEAVTWAGRTFRLEDTAGRRDAEDPVELEGVQRSAGAVQRADVVIEVRDGRSAGSHPGGIAVCTHADLISTEIRAALLDDGWLLVAAPTGDVEGLRDALVADTRPASGALLHTVRQHDAVRAAATSLAEAEGLGGDEPVLAAVALRAAGRRLEELVGAWSSEEVLDALFERFCIGK